MLPRNIPWYIFFSILKYSMRMVLVISLGQSKQDNKIGACVAAQPSQIMHYL